MSDEPWVATLLDNPERAHEAHAAAVAEFQETHNEYRDLDGDVLRIGIAYAMISHLARQLRQERNP